MKPIPVEALEQWIMVWRPYLEELLDAVDALPDATPFGSNMQKPIVGMACVRDAVAQIRGTVPQHGMPTGEEATP